MASLHHPHKIHRRTVLAAAAASLATTAGAANEDPKPAADRPINRGAIRQSVVHWCFSPMSVDELAREAAAMGIQSVELVAPEHWPTLKKYGLICAISGSHGFAKGFADPKHHDECLEKLRQSIDATSAAGWPSVITFSGITKGISKEDGLKNAVAGLKKIIGHAEKKRVNLCLEMLNTRVAAEMKGHPGYLADTVEWVIDVCKQVGSPRMKLLFDIYHVQIMQGDLIVRIEQFKDYIGHYHTAGVPGRGELHLPQEINYPAVMKAIVATGYRGFVGQEFIPTGRDKVAALAAAARLCDV
jgi:hydroxypyruvate isomerase